MSWTVCISAVSAFSSSGSVRGDRHHSDLPSAFLLCLTVDCGQVETMPSVTRWREGASMSEPFAKLYETSELGQVLVKLDRSEESTPEVRVYIAPPKLGICSLAYSWRDDDEGWDKAEAYLASMDEAKAIELGRLIAGQANSLTESSDDR
jgi:hypothetical protein